MKKLLIVAALALAAGSHAQAASPRLHAPDQLNKDFARGSWTCTIAHAPTTKLFMDVKGHFARAAVREYPYYGKTEYKILVRASRTAATVSYRGASGFLSLRATSQDGVMRGVGRIGTTLMLLTCARS